MDRSVDSIGSCSLDVDADSSDVSDTSGSLNFATPISAKDITREFTAKITERCQISQNTTTYIDRVSGQIHTILTPRENQATSPGKKPSYLNLACCVNGYSNLTTYDSKVRQDINKSREVSPIRPSANSIQHCKKNNSLAPPIIVTPCKPYNNHCGVKMNANQYLDNRNENNDTLNMTQVDNAQFIPQQSFIQQRVERLYGPGALAQVFYSPKKCKTRFGNKILNERSPNTESEFCRKFQQLSINRYTNQLNKSVGDVNNVPRNNLSPSQDVTDHSANNSIDLPVLRHLSQEFRAQLPSISPKRSYIKSPNSHFNGIINNYSEHHNDLKVEDTETNKELSDRSSIEAISVESVVLSSPKRSEDLTQKRSEKQLKDGVYFLEVLKKEQLRILDLAQQAEKYIRTLSNNEDVSEEVLGLLRSASGKARLLVSQKMKQFEGLCHNNINRSPEDTFPTTIEDLQGFWDMMFLQVEHIDSIFKEIEDLSKNDWKLKSIEETSPTMKTPRPTPNSKSQKPKTSSMLNGSSSRQGSVTPKTPSAAALKREAQRKQLMELKRRNKLAINTDSPESRPDNAVEIFVVENNS